jgi:hypothetical protein
MPGLRTGRVLEGGPVLNSGRHWSSPSPGSMFCAPATFQLHLQYLEQCYIVAHYHLKIQKLRGVGVPATFPQHCDPLITGKRPFVSHLSQQASSLNNCFCFTVLRAFVSVLGTSCSKSFGIGLMWVGSRLLCNSLTGPTGWNYVEHLSECSYFSMMEEVAWRCSVCSSTSRSTVWIVEVAEAPVGSYLCTCLYN